MESLHGKMFKHANDTEGQKFVIQIPAVMNIVRYFPISILNL